MKRKDNENTYCQITMIMKPREFFDTVAKMRQAQKEYFKTRSHSALRQSKALEREVDAEIERVNKIIGAPTAFPVQGDIFSQPDN